MNKNKTNITRIRLRSYCIGEYDNEEVKRLYTNLKRGITVRELVAEIGISAATFHNVVRGRVGVDKDIFRNLVEVLKKHQA